MRVEFRHPAVRDLAWVIGSPLLLASGPGLYAPQRVTERWRRLAFWDRIPWLRALDHRPEPLERWLAERPSQRLGRRFEVLVAFWLHHWRRTELRAAGVSVVDPGRRTVGEFDFLFCDRGRDRWVHWEAAVKFYLYHRDGNGAVQWLGPNPQDRLEHKLARLVEHQLRLGRRPEAGPVLNRLGVQDPVPEAYVKGYLFYPAGDAPSAPPEVAPGHLRGWWTRAGERHIPRHGAETRWVVLERMGWLARVRVDEAAGVGWEGLQELLDRAFRGGVRPLLLAELQRGRDRRWGEVSRGFVVPDGWPAQAADGTVD